MSLSIRIIPCLDVTDGRVVKGVNFTDLVDAGDPVEMGSLYGHEGADELTFLDISASVAGRETTLDVVRKTAEQVFIPLTVGGGIRTVDDVNRLLRAGADKVSMMPGALEPNQAMKSQLMAVVKAQASMHSRGLKKPAHLESAKFSSTRWMQMELELDMTSE